MDAATEAEWAVEAVAARREGEEGEESAASKEAGKAGLAVGEAPSTSIASTARLFESVDEVDVIVACQLQYERGR